MPGLPGPGANRSDALLHHDDLQRRQAAKDAVLCSSQCRTLHQETLRRTMSTQQRVTATLQRRAGRAVHVRKATRAEPQHHKLNDILGLARKPGGTHRMVI